MVLQTLHSADARDAEKLALNLSGFVAKMADANGIPQQVSSRFVVDFGGPSTVACTAHTAATLMQVVRELPARGALLTSPRGASL